LTRVLIIEDEKLMRWSLCQRMQEAGYEALEAATGAAGLARFREGADVVLLDYCLPDMDGLEVLRELHEIDSEPPVILLTAHASVESAVLAMKQGPPLRPKAARHGRGNPASGEGSRDDAAQP